MSIKTIITNLGRSKGRTALTISSIAVGIFAVSVISAVGRIGTGKINRSLDDMGINSVLVESSTVGVDLNDEDVAALSTVGGIEKAMPLMMTITECELIGSRIKCMTWGVSNNAEDIISLHALHGRLIGESDIASSARVCVVDADIAKQTYGRTNIVGKKIGVTLDGKYEQFEIVGVATSGLNAVQSIMNDVVPYFVYLPYTTVQSLSNTQAYDKIALSIDKNSRTEATIEEIADCLERRKGNNTITVNNLLGQKQQLDGILSTAASSLSLVAGISLIVSAISVMTSMLVSVNERKREIGIKKALGAKNSRIVGEFLAESMTISILGSLIGTLCGTIISAVGCMYIGEPFSWQLDTMLAAIVICAVIGMLSGSYPAYKAAKMKPVDALKA